MLAAVAAALQDAVDVELDGDAGPHRHAQIDPLGLAVGRDVARGALHGGVAAGDGVIALGAARGLDLGDAVLVRVVEIEEVRGGFGDALGIQVRGHVAEPEPEIAHRGRKADREGCGIAACSDETDAIDVEGRIEAAGGGAE